MKWRQLHQRGAGHHCSKGMLVQVWGRTWPPLHPPSLSLPLAEQKVTAVHMCCFWWFTSHPLMSQGSQTKAEKVGGGHLGRRLSFFSRTQSAPGWSLLSLPLTLKT